MAETGELIKLKYNKKIKEYHRHFDILLDDKVLETDASILPIYTNDGRLLKIEVLRDGTVVIGWFVDTFEAQYDKFDKGVTLITKIGGRKWCS